MYFRTNEIPLTELKYLNVLFICGWILIAVYGSGPGLIKGFLNSETHKCLKGSSVARLSYLFTMCRTDGRSVIALTPLV